MRHVHKHEFKCPCCAENLINANFVDRLNAAREKAKRAFIITSGYRCEDHNVSIGGSVNSAHIAGLGADIRAETAHDRHEIMVALLSCGFNRIGIYERHIHVDQSEVLPQRVLWYGRYK